MIMLEDPSNTNSSSSSLSEAGVQNELRLSEERLRLMINAVQDYGIFLLDPSGRITSWNEGAQRIKGYTRDEIIGKHFSIFYPLDAISRGWPDFELAAAREKGRFEDEGWRIRKDGTRFWANVVITALFESDGQLVGYTKVTRDLTERRQHEEALRQSEHRFQLMVEAVRDYGIFLLDSTGHIVSWNEGAERIKGYTAQEIIGKHFSVFYPDEALQIKWPQYELDEAVRTGRFEDEGWRLRKDGSRFWANVVITALFEETGEHLGFTKVTRDLTERRAHEDALRRSERQLSQANLELSQRNRELQDFAHVASHDLQEPLRKISAFSEILEDEYAPKLDEEGRMYLDRVRDAAKRMTALIDELLSYSRTATRTKSYGPVDLNMVIDDVKSDLHVRLDETGGRINWGLLPTVIADVTQMRQLFQNLVGNALKFHREDVVPEVIISAREVPEQSSKIGVDAYEITVADNGIGVEPRYTESIFAPFRRIHENRGIEGSGLGLAICRRIVERHEGMIFAESELDQGSIFTIYLPKKVESSSQVTSDQ